MSSAEDLQVERIILWYYRTSGLPVTRFQAFRIKLSFFLGSGKWLKDKIYTTQRAVVLRPSD